MSSSRRARSSFVQSRQRVIRRNDGNVSNSADRLDGDVGIAKFLTDQNGKVAAFFEERRDRSAQWLDSEPYRHRWMFDAHLAQGAADCGQWKQRIERERQFQLQTIASASCSCAHSVHPKKDIAGVGEQALSFSRHHRTMCRAVKQLHL